MTSWNGNISALLALRAVNSPVNDEFPSQRPVTRSFHVFFDQRLNKRLSKQSNRRWFWTPSFVQNFLNSDYILSLGTIETTSRCAWIKYYRKIIKKMRLKMSVKMVANLHRVQCVALHKHNVVLLLLLLLLFGVFCFVSVYFLGYHVDLFIYCAPFNLGSTRPKWWILSCQYSAGDDQTKIA